MKIKPEHKKTFIENELYYELRCLLGAATIWQIFKNNDQGFDVAVAADSVYLHARNLFNFFTKQQSKHDISITEFGLKAPFKVPIWNKWEGALNRHVSHISPGRSNPQNLKANGHLNKQIIKFAEEILNLWKQLESNPASKAFSSTFRAARKRAIKDAANDASGRLEPLF